MQVEALPLPGLLLIQPSVFSDARGFFLETYQAERYRALGVACDFVQDNHSRSVRGTLRGLHYQSSPGQAKLIRCAAGKIFDVVVDIRPGSPTFGRSHSVELDGLSHAQLFVPIGFAHGFCVVSEEADVIYKVSAPYDAATEKTIQWNDPALGIAWPIAEPTLSARDRAGEPFATYAARVRG